MYVVFDDHGNLLVLDKVKGNYTGMVYWIPVEQFRQTELATGTEYVLEMAESGKALECYMKLEVESYRGTLY